MDTWVCPNDRQLALRAKLGTGWSIHTPKSTTPFKTHQALTEEETNRILQVIKRAEKLEQMELLRVGSLVDRLEKLKTNSQGDGRLRCGLCGDQFRLLGASPNLCRDCSKNVCSKCGIETYNSKSRLIYLCKICSERRELWRKSGAWFYKGLPHNLKPSITHKRSRDDNNNSLNRNYNNFQKNYNNDSGSVSSGSFSLKNDFKNSEKYSRLKDNEKKYSYINNTSKSDNKNDFYYNHFKYKPSFLINASCENNCMTDDDLDESSNVNVNESDNEMDMINRLQHNRRAILKNKKKDNNNNSNNNNVIVDKENNDYNYLPESPPKNYLSWINNKNKDNDNESDKNNKTNDKNHNNNKTNDTNQNNNSEESDLQTNFKLPTFTHYIRSSKKCSSDEEENNDGGYDNDDSLNIVCKKVRPKESESDNSSYDINHSTNQSINRSSDLSTNRSITQSSDKSTSSASINQLTNNLPTNQSHSDVSINQLTVLPLNPMPDQHVGKAKNKNADLLPLHIPANFVFEEDGSSVPETPASLGVLEFSLQFISKENILRCLIQRAKNLPAMDKRGLCDAFVRIHMLPGNVKATKKRTKVVEGNRNPEWDEVVDYHGVFAEDLKKKEIRLSILDEDTISDKFIGETIVNLKGLGVDVCKEYSVYLSGLQVIGEGNEVVVEGGEAGRIQIGLSYETQNGKFVVHVYRCVNLLAMDSNGFSDPYVKMYLKPPRDRKTKKKTRVKLKTLNPQFNEEFSYRVKQTDLASKTLEIAVWDKDIGRNDFIGKINLGKDSDGSGLKHWMDVIMQSDHVHTQWHILKHIR